MEPKEHWTLSEWNSYQQENGGPPLEIPTPDDHVTWIKVTCKGYSQTFAVRNGKLKINWFIDKADTVEGLQGETVKLFKDSDRSHYRVVRSV